MAVSVDNFGGGGRRRDPGNQLQDHGGICSVIIPGASGV